MSFRTASRVAAPIAAVSLLLLGLGVSGAWYVQRLQRQVSQLLDSNVAGIRAAEELEMDLLQFRYELNRFLVERDSNDLVRAIAMRTKVEECLVRCERIAISPEETSDLRLIRDGLTRTFTRLDEIVATFDPRTADRQVEELIAPVLSDEILPVATAFLDRKEVQLEASSQENQRLADRLVLALLLLGTCGSIAGLVAGYGMARGISRSITELSLPVRDVAGQLSEIVGPVTISSNPSLDDLQLVLNAVSREVETVIRQLHERQRELLHTDQLAALGQLAAGLPHELRNPLMCMSVLVQSALANPGARLEDRDLQVLDEEIGRLDRLLQQFLDFARPGEMEMADVDLREPVELTGEFVTAKARQLLVDVTIRVPSDPVVVRADATRLRQLVLNLLLNALDATARGGGIEVAVVADDGPWCRITIADDGHGVREEDVGRLFEPFVSTRDGGLGMGLAICRRIVEAHGGTIAIANRPEGGAIVAVRLPCRESTTNAVSASRAAPQSLTS